MLLVWGLPVLIALNDQAQKKWEEKQKKENPPKPTDKGMKMGPRDPSLY